MWQALLNIFVQIFYDCLVAVILTFITCSGTRGKLFGEKKVVVVPSNKGTPSFKLPSVLFYYTLTYLRPYEIARMECVSSYCKTFVDDSKIWKTTQDLCYPRQYSGESQIIMSSKRLREESTPKQYCELRHLDSLKWWRHVSSKSSSLQNSVRRGMEYWEKFTWYYCLVVGAPAFLHHYLTIGFPAAKVTFMDVSFIFAGFWGFMCLFYFTGIRVVVFAGLVCFIAIYKKVLFYIFLVVNLGYAVLFKLLFECLAGFPSTPNYTKLFIFTLMVWILRSIQIIEPESTARLEFEGVCFLALLPYIIYVSFNVDPSPYRSLSNIVATALNAHQFLLFIKLENVIHVLSTFGPTVVEGPLLIAILLATSNRVIMAQSLGFGDRRRLVAILHNVASFTLFCCYRFQNISSPALFISILLLVSRYILAKLSCLILLRSLGLEEFWNKQSKGIFDRSQFR